MWLLQSYVDMTMRGKANKNHSLHCLTIFNNPVTAYQGND